MRLPICLAHSSLRRLSVIPPHHHGHGFGTDFLGYYSSSFFASLPEGLRSILTSMPDCLSVSLFVYVCPLAQLENRTAEITRFCACCPWPYWLGPTLWRCDALYTPGSVDDVMFSYNGANGPESSTTLCLEEVCQVAVPVGRHATVFGRVHQNVSPRVKSAVYNLPVFIFDFYALSWLKPGYWVPFTVYNKRLRSTCGRRNVWRHVSHCPSARVGSHAGNLSKRQVESNRSKSRQWATCCRCVR